MPVLETHHDGSTLEVQTSPARPRFPTAQSFLCLLIALGAFALSSLSPSYPFGWREGNAIALLGLAGFLILMVMWLYTRRMTLAVPQAVISHDGTTIMSRSSYGDVEVPVGQVQGFRVHNSQYGQRPSVFERITGLAAMQSCYYVVDAMLDNRSRRVAFGLDHESAVELSRVLTAHTDKARDTTPSQPIPEAPAIA